MTSLTQRIRQVLAEPGELSHEAEFCWWGAPRDELAGRSPFQVAMAEGDACAERLLAIAMQDALGVAEAERAADKLEAHLDLARWEGTDG